MQEVKARMGKDEEMFMRLRALASHIAVLTPKEIEHLNRQIHFMSKGKIEICKRE
jgi:hypothetical protein